MDPSPDENPNGPLTSFGEAVLIACMVALALAVLWAVLA
jgi:hypothetical protein